MKTFITDDFLLCNNIAKELYFNVAKDLPIIDYHNHLDPKLILKNVNFENITEAWLNGDHYKWRAMRANGVHEDYITGNKSDYEKFVKWAETVPYTLGNPLFHWAHLELLRYFNIDVSINKSSAPSIWEKTKALLQQPEYSVRSLLQEFNVEFIGTTDDPTDSLDAHISLEREGFDIKVSPSFRPDRALLIEDENFLAWVKELGEVTGLLIENYDTFLQALEKRVNFFDDCGCRSSDHGIDVMFFQNTTKNEVNTIYNKRIKEEKLTEDEIEKFKTYTLLHLGELYYDKGWAMQLHLGAIRNNNKRMYEKLGPDTGYDSIGDFHLASKLSSFLDSLEQQNKLPKTILYCLNSRDNQILASMAGNFQSSEIKGKVQLGTAWWFHDTIDGMEEQLKTIANIGLISNFIGMVTDSRSFLSLTRHEYFRRVLCNLLGVWVEQGKAPNDFSLLSKYVSDICYYNVKHYFQLDM